MRAIQYFPDIIEPIFVEVVHFWTPLYFQRAAKAALGYFIHSFRNVFCTSTNRPLGHLPWYATIHNRWIWGCDPVFNRSGGSGYAHR